MLVSGCSGGSNQAKDKTTSDSNSMLDNEEIICRSNKKIWIGWKSSYNKGGLTSEVIGDCNE